MENRGHQEIVIAFRKGEEKAFGEVYELFSGPIYLFARRILNSDTEAQDVTAETFMKLWNLRDNFETIQNIKAFLYITVRNGCFNILRKRKNTIRHKEDLNYLLSQNEEGPSQQDEIKAEVLKNILRELNNLPKQCRQVVEFSFIKGLKNTEIATELGLSLQTVKNHKNRGLRILKFLLGRREWQMLLVFFPDFFLSY
jgi:RNA polymerase sigma-70 factor (family 1)